MRKIDVLSLDGKLLKTFLTVFETKSVTRAAENLDVSQSAVSHSLEKLRECMGDPLFVRSGRGIAPTHLAVTLAPKVAQILGDIESLTLQKDYIPDADLSAFTIATNVTELLPLLLAVKQSIWRHNKKIPLRFVDLGARTNALEALSSGSADVALTVSIGSHPVELMVERFYQDSIVCFFDATQRHAPATLEQYCAARHGAVDFGGNNKSLVETALDNEGASRHIHLFASNSFALANLAKNTDLIITLPKRLEMIAFEGFSYSTPPFVLPTVSYDLVYHRRNRSSSRSIWFRDVLKTASADFQQNSPIKS